MDSTVEGLLDAADAKFDGLADDLDELAARIPAGDAKTMLEDVQKYIKDAEHLFIQFRQTVQEEDSD